MSRRARDWTAIALGVIAVAIAAYLTLVHYEEDLLVCSVLHGCATVQQSDYAMIGPVPVALLGLLASLAMVAVAIWRLVNQSADRFLATAILAGMLLASLLYLSYLTYLELFVIDAICQWCVAYLIVTTLWFGLEAWGIRSDLIVNDGDPGDDAVHE